MKYRKKPIIVDAFKWMDDPDGIQEPQWFAEALKKSEDETGVARRYLAKDAEPFIEIKSLYGMALAKMGDYIIKEGGISLSVCDPIIFEATYEKVES